MQTREYVSRTQGMWADLGPAAGAGLGQKRLVCPIHGHHLVGGLGPVGPTPPDDCALMQAQLVQLN